MSIGCRVKPKVLTNTYKILIVCGPSGVGKSTLVDKLKDEFPQYFGSSISHTTRKRRPYEKNGVHFHFISRNTMEREILQGKFLEYTVFAGNLYGTKMDAIIEACAEERVCVLNINTAGVKTVRKRLLEGSVKAAFIFVKPPSMKELADRLLNRGTETEVTIKKRLDASKLEMSYVRNHAAHFNLIIVNDNFDQAYQQFKQFIFTTFAIADPSSAPSSKPPSPPSPPPPSPSPSTSALPHS